MNDKELHQKAGDGAIQNQTLSGNIIQNYYSISPKEIKEVAMEVFWDNFIKLKGEAAKIASMRAEKILGDFLKRLEAASPSILANLGDPALQTSIFEVQKQYAISGDENIGDLLVNILLERVQISERSLNQIVLDMVIETTGKLTQTMIDTLSFLFFLKNVRFENVESLDRFYSEAEDFLLPYAGNLCKTKTDLYLLQKQGFLEQLPIPDANFSGHFVLQYPNVFQEEFSLEEFESKVGVFDQRLEFAVKSLDNDRFRIKYTKPPFEILAKAIGIPEMTTKKLSRFADSQKMHVNEVNRILGLKFPQFDWIIEMYNTLGFGGLRVAGAGICIAVANHNRKSGQNLNWTEFLQ